ncbi:MAG: hypothetical protein [Caudoviricetes sp.]|nr:MAG: hypothetical protein [Caudoviricetes sp.]
MICFRTWVRAGTVVTSTLVQVVVAGQFQRRKMMHIREVFEKHDGEFLKYRSHDHLKNENCQYRIFSAIGALIGNNDIIIDARYGEVFLNGEPDVVLSIYGEDGVVDLIRMGLRWSDDHDCFCLFV